MFEVDLPFLKKGLVKHHFNISKMVDPLQKSSLQYLISYLLHVSYLLLFFLTLENQTSISTVAYRNTVISPFTTVILPGNNSTVA